MVRTQPTSVAEVVALGASDSCSNDTWRNGLSRAIILTVFTSIASQPWVQCQEGRRAVVYKTDTRLRGPPNCNYTLVMTL